MDFEFIIAGEKLFRQQNGGKMLSKLKLSQKDYWPVTSKLKTIWHWSGDIWNSKEIFTLCPQVNMWVGEVRASSTFLRENVETEEEKNKK